MWIKAYAENFNQVSVAAEGMQISEITPVILYDNRCSSCSSFARTVDRLSGHRLSMVGHYTRLGEQIRTAIGDGAEDMFWVIDGDRARGGRSGLCALAMLILGRKRSALQRIGMKDGVCDDTCGGPRAVMYRSCSALTQSRTVRLGSHSLNI